MRKTVKQEEPRKLKQAISQLLSDEKRTEAPATVTAVQKAETIALACKKPRALSLPFSHWTNQLLQGEAIFNLLKHCSWLNILMRLFLNKRFSLTSVIEQKIHYFIHDYHSFLRNLLIGIILVISSF